MTCIIALKTPTNVIIGADRGITFGSDHKETSSISKIIKKPNNIYMAWSGSFIVGNLLSVFEMPDRQQPDPYLYLVGDVVPALRKLFVESGITNMDSGTLGYDGSILIILDGRIFTVCCCFSVTEHQSDWVTIGSGQDYASGSLHTTDGFEESFGMTSQTRVVLALEASLQYSCTVGRPFDIVEASI